MILDVKSFVAREERLWKELESMLDKISGDASATLHLDEISRLHYLYSRVSEDLVRISTLSGETEIRKYLQALVARAYSHIHGRGRKRLSSSLKHLPMAVFRWFILEFPAAFRRNFAYFAIASAIFLLGSFFGGVVLMVENDAKEILIPEFAHLMQSPGERVKSEESKAGDTADFAPEFAAFLMTNNIRVSIHALILGVSWGIGTVLVLFYNGVILGCVALDYILDGHVVFMLGWLLPHGSIEIPCILIAGQAGLMLGHCMLKPGPSGRLAALKSRSADMCSLIGGVAIILVWAAVIEAFFSQHHEPSIPYSVKIVFGMIQLALLIAFLAVPLRKNKNAKT